MNKLLKSLGAATVAAAAALTLALPASAAVNPIPVTVFISDSSTGLLTSPAALRPGEVLDMFGYGTGTFTVTSLTPDGPVDVVTLSPAVSPALRGEVLDFKVVSL